MKFDQDLEGLTWDGQPIMHPVKDLLYSQITMSFNLAKNCQKDGYKLASAPEMYNYLKEVALRMSSEEKFRMMAQEFVEKLGPPDIGATLVHTNTIVSYGGNEAMMSYNHYPHENFVYKHKLDNPGCFREPLDSITRAGEIFVQAMFNTKDELSEIEWVLKKITGHSQVLLYNVDREIKEHPLRQVTFSHNSQGMCIGTPAWPEIKGYVPMIKVKNGQD